MYLKKLELSGFKSFAEKREFLFTSPVTAVVGPNGSGKSNVAEAFRFVLGEQSMKSMRTKRGEDLIWNGSRMTGRKNRAMVTVTFDNKDGIFPVDYSEVTLSREVGRDGTNRYLINDAQVRLKDVLGLLASAKIGSSAHHIISQGETDRVLRANPQERRAMIEDALGLRIYQYKITESKRKLIKTEENMTQIGQLQKEIEPHLKFLEKQVERIEEARALREELLERSKAYFSQEDFCLKRDRKEALAQKEKEEKALSHIDEEIGLLKRTLGEEEESESQRKILHLEDMVEEVRNQKTDITRKLGRLEGMISLEERQLELDQKKKEEGFPSSFSYERVSGFFSELQNNIDRIVEGDDVGVIRTQFSEVKKKLMNFLYVADNHHEEKSKEAESRLDGLKKERGLLEHSFQMLEQKEEGQRKAHNDLKNEMEQERGRFRSVEREMFEKMSQRNEAASRVREIESKVGIIDHRLQDFKEDLNEFSMLLGRGVLDYEAREDGVGTNELSDRSARERERKELERKRIKVEEMGGSGEEVIEEYENLKERKEFLAREVEDLLETKNSLENLIADLEEHLNEDFKNGLKNINTVFQEYFELMFDGGNVSLTLERTQKKKKKNARDDEALVSDVPNAEVAGSSEEEDQKKNEPGLEINVSLPKKRVKGIQMLSGGERSLTSIALLFAVSQVNPPPFLILDETDAALDEANSRRYGEMIEKLSERTQLVIITHNRETMSRAGVLYGITVGRDAVSKVLSVKLEDAQEDAAR